MLLPAPTTQAAGPDPAEFRNHTPSQFGTTTLPPYADLPAGSSVPFRAELTLHPELLRTPAARYLVGFNLHDTVGRVTDVQLTRDGQPVPFERDERADPLQPRLILPASSLPANAPVELLLTGTATADANGQVHVGVLALAFDAGWGALRTRDGALAQVYAFTLLMSTGHASSGLEPGFRGQGNDALALAPLGGLALVMLGGLRAAWRRLHPAPPKPARAVPVPAASAPDPPHLRPTARPPPPAAMRAVARPLPPALARPVRPAAGPASRTHEPRPLAMADHVVVARASDFGR